MKFADKPANEEDRLQSLHASGLPESGPSERFDRLTRMAKRIFDVPVAMLNLVDADQLLPHSCIGLAPEKWDRETSLCSHVILQSTPLIVSDLLEDPRFHDAPATTHQGLRFYAGCPVHMPDGFAVGALCISDIRPRQLSEDEVAVLQDLAAIVEDSFAVLTEARLDELTGLANRRGFDVLASYALAGARRREKPACLCFIDLDGFKIINDTWGHEAGDRALSVMSGLMMQCFREDDVIGRRGGDEFSILFTDSSLSGASRAMEVLQRKVSLYNETSGQPWQLHFSWGMAQYDPLRHSSLRSLLQLADRRMYQMKKSRQQAR
jgi:diguanylate cyclase (GGDEF)-like protein